MHAPTGSPGDLFLFYRPKIDANNCSVVCVLPESGLYGTLFFYKHLSLSLALAPAK
jgi:hypothetical protein